MYLQNKYTRWYNNIISNAKLRKLSGYTETHHIIPVSLGGSNDSSNLVVLTAREHYICHVLLTKMTTGKARKSMTYALWMMTNASSEHQQRYRCASILYEMARKNFIGSQKGHKNYLTKQSSAAKKQISKTMKARLAKLSQDEMRERMLNSCHNPNSWTNERKQKISEATTGVKKTKTPRLLAAEAQRKNRTAEQKLKCGAAHKGKTWKLIDGKRVWMEKE
jgi:hypothetical protein